MNSAANKIVSHIEPITANQTINPSTTIPAKTSVAFHLWLRRKARFLIRILQTSSSLINARCGLTSRAQARGNGGIRQPATSRQTEGAIPRCLQRFVRPRFHITTNSISNDDQKLRPCHHREMLRKTPICRPANLSAKKRNPSSARLKRQAGQVWRKRPAGSCLL